MFAGFKQLINHWREIQPGTNIWPIVSSHNSTLIARLVAEDIEKLIDLEERVSDLEEKFKKN